jgi:hypothetical protein
VEAKTMKKGSLIWRIDAKDGEKVETVLAKNIIIATVQPRVPRQDRDTTILDNTGALARGYAQKAGVIGEVESSAWKRSL